MPERKCSIYLKLVNLIKDVFTLDLEYSFEAVTIT